MSRWPWAVGGAALSVLALVLASVFLMWTDRESSPAGPGASAPSAGQGAFPNASNTGVPAGVTLSPYAGPMTVTTPGTVIEGKLVKGDLLIQADDVTVTKSRIEGRLSSDAGGSVTVEDSEIDGGDQEMFPSVSFSDITLRRVDVTGGQHSVQCSENCTVVDSWLHDQYLPAHSAGHVNAFISNGGTHMVLRHNTLHCTVPLTPQDGGCTADLSLFGDFGPISDVTVDHNLFKSNNVSMSYCTQAGYSPGKPYGSHPAGVRYTNNVFERGGNGKCGVYGPVTSFLDTDGNTWTGNTWQDGKPVPPA